MTTYLALLRGINVGGNNLIKMLVLKACFERLGFEKVATYIQSGNVLFDTNTADQAALANQIEATLSKTFHYQSRIVLRTHDELAQIVQSAPNGFGSQPGVYRYDVIFLREPLTAEEAMQQMPTKEGVDAIWAGPRVVYFSRLTSKATQSRLPRIVGMPIYQHMTIRNWNTTTTLLTLMDERADSR